MSMGSRGQLSEALQECQGELTVALLVGGILVALLWWGAAPELQQQQLLLLQQRQQQELSATGRCQRHRHQTEASQHRQSTRPPADTASGDTSASCSEAQVDGRVLGGHLTPSWIPLLLHPVSSQSVARHQLSFSMNLCR